MALGNDKSSLQKKKKKKKKKKPKLIAQHRIINRISVEQNIQYPAGSQTPNNLHITSNFLLFEPMMNIKV
jgi:hypothetical protein